MTSPHEKPIPPSVEKRAMDGTVCVNATLISAVRAAVFRMINEADDLEMKSRMLRKAAIKLYVEIDGKA